MKARLRKEKPKKSVKTVGFCYFFISSLMQTDDFLFIQNKI